MESHLFFNCDLDEKRESNIQSVDSLYINRTSYLEQLEGFWLGTSIANWTGLVTEMDKIGNTNDISTLPFYTREDWGQMDKPAIWDGESISQISNTIDFVLRTPGELWGADDDTDIEYMYQHLILKYKQPKLNPRQIRDGWLEHISSIEENYLWVSNQQALDLMNKGYLPPDTGDPRFNEHYEMIDAQLTTEIFGLFAPGNPDVARDLASLPIQTVARNEAEDIAQFYVTMFSLASLNPEKVYMTELIQFHYMLVITYQMLNILQRCMIIFETYMSLIYHGKLHEIQYIKPTKLNKDTAMT